MRKFSFSKSGITRRTATWRRRCYPMSLDALGIPGGRLQGPTSANGALCRKDIGDRGRRAELAPVSVPDIDVQVGASAPDAALCDVHSARLQSCEFRGAHCAFGGFFRAFQPVRLPASAFKGRDPHDLAEVPRPVGIPLASRPSGEQAHQLDQSLVNSRIVAIERRFSARSIRALFHRAF